MKKQIDPNLNGSQDDIVKSLGIDGNIKGKSSSSNANDLKLDLKRHDNDTSVENILKNIEEGRKDSSNQPVLMSSEHIRKQRRHHSEHHHSEHSGEHHHHGEHYHHHHHGEHSGGHHHHHHDEHNSQNKKNKKEKKKTPAIAKVLIAIILVLVLIFLTVFGTFIFLQQKGKKDLKPDLNNAINYQDTIEYKGHTYQYNDNLFTFAFMGVDQMDMKTSDETDFVGAADATIVVSIDLKTGKSNIVAIPRDMMVDVDTWSDNGTFLKTIETQLCLAYAYGNGRALSCENQMTSMSRALYNIPIQKYFMLDLSGVPPLNDAIGGVKVNSLYDLPNFGIQKGEDVTLQGEAATAYVRTRDMDHLEASLSRMERQVQYVKAYTNQLLPAVLNDFSTVSRLYNTATRYSQTNISLPDATYLASMLLSKGVSDFDTYSIQGHMESDPDAVFEDVVHAKFYPDEDNLMQTVLAVFYNQID